MQPLRFFGPIVPLSAYKRLKPQIYRALEDTTNCLLKLNISSTLTTKTCLLSLIGFKVYVLTYLWIYLMLICRPYFYFISYIFISSVNLFLYGRMSGSFYISLFDSLFKGFTTITSGYVFFTKLRFMSCNED